MLHLGLDELSNQKILKGMIYTSTTLIIFQILIDLYLPHMDRRKFALASSTPLEVAELTMKKMGTKSPNIMKQ